MSIFIHHANNSLELSTGTHLKSPTCELSHLLNQLKEPNSKHRLRIETNSPDQLLKEIAAQFHWMEAAGGVIEQSTGEILLIYRRGSWDLPKGKIDGGETPLEAAVREIQEETGLDELTWIENLSPTYHIYPWNKEWVLKKTHWFRFQCKNPNQLVLQQEEDIEDAQWLLPGKLETILDQTYPSLHPLLRSIIA